MDPAVIFSEKNFLHAVDSVARLSSRAVPHAAVFQFLVVCALEGREYITQLRLLDEDRLPHRALMSSDVQNPKTAASNFPWQRNHSWRRKMRGAMRCQAQYTVGIYAKLGKKFAKLTKMQNSFAKPLDRSF